MKQILEDLKDHNSNAENGLNSVSQGLVYFGHPEGVSESLLRYSVETVCCIEHGAMLCMTTWKKGTLWRCPTCNEGAVLLNQNEQTINTKGVKE